jgi:hypothetical protein
MSASLTHRTHTESGAEDLDGHPGELDPFPVAPDTIRT